MSSNPRRDDDTGLLGELLRAIRRAAESTDGEYHTTGQGRGDAFDYEVSVRTGLGPGAPGRKGHPAFQRSTEPATADRPVRVETDGELRRVTVDLEDTDLTAVEDVQISLDGADLTVVVGGEPTARARLDGDGPWTVVESKLNNGVFEAVLKQA